MAEFKYYLNRQGVRGPQGPQGEKGFSPDISVEKDTLSEYVLRITNEGGYFLTANLREHKEDRGGTYIRYDRTKGEMYAGDAELATTDTLGVIRIAGDDDFAGKAEDAAVTPAQVQDYTTAKITEVNQRIDSLDANNVKVTGDQAIEGRKVFRDRIESNYVYTDHVYGSNGERIFINEDILAIGNTQKPTVLYSKGAGVTLNGNTDYVLTQSRVTAGDGVAIEKTTSGIKISSSAPTNVVTTDTDQLILGTKTFNSGQTFFQRGFVLGSLESIRTSDTVSRRLLTYNDYSLEVGIDDRTTKILGSQVVDGSNKKFLVQGSVTAGDNISIEETTDGIKISSTGGGAGDVTLAGDNSFTGNNTFDGVSTFNGDTWINSLKVGTSLTNQQDKKFLAQGNITAGSDNLVIADTTDGVQITCNAPTNAQIEALQRLINDLSTKVDNLTTRLNNLEEVIDGGVAGSIYPADPQKIDANPIIDNALSGGQAQSEEIQVKDGE